MGTTLFFVFQFIIIFKIEKTFYSITYLPKLSIYTMNQEFLCVPSENTIYFEWFNIFKYIFVMTLCYEVFYNFYGNKDKQLLSIKNIVNPLYIEEPKLCVETPTLYIEKPTPCVDYNDLIKEIDNLKQENERLKEQWKHGSRLLVTLLTK